MRMCKSFPQIHPFSGQLFHKHALDMRRWAVANETCSVDLVIIVPYLTSVSGVIVLLKTSKMPQSIMRMFIILTYIQRILHGGEKI